MQGEVPQITLPVCVSTTKMTIVVLKKLTAAYQRHQKQISAEQKAQKNHPKQGKITVKRQAKQNAVMTNRLSTPKNIKSCER